MLSVFSETLWQKAMRLKAGSEVRIHGLQSLCLMYFQRSIAILYALRENLIHHPTMVIRFVYLDRTIASSSSNDRLTIVGILIQSYPYAINHKSLGHSDYAIHILQASKEHLRIISLKAIRGSMLKALNPAFNRLLQPYLPLIKGFRES